MHFELIVCESTNNSASQFWKAITIWMKNPHVVNRRILTSRELLIVEVNCNVVDIFEHIEKLQVQFDEFEHYSSSTENIKCLLDMLNIARYCQSIECINPIATLNNDKTYLYVKKLLPRNTLLFSSTLEFVYVDKKSMSITTFHKSIIPNKQSLGPSIAYNIQHEEYNFTSIGIYKSQDQDYNKECGWLKSKFFPRLIKWMKSECDNTNRTKINSLSLISGERYTLLYNQLKEKYGTKMIKIWPENTDPLKFVFEDIAIATYLLLLWEKERLEKNIQELQSFVDLGCGNGLLVYILSNEGHKGTGIDLRKRKIWELFPENTHLQVSTIIPSSNTVFPEIDWIIGNHSDELTPWIPVIAARSSYECRFFLLPCCAYEFDGRKYQRNNASESQYSEFMSYVKSICEGCGFLTQVDKLRIPSTKRTCFVGWKRNYAKEDTITSLDADIQRIINAKSISQRNVTEMETNNDAWSINFKPRSSLEQTRNCTQLDKKLIFDIVNIVATHLLHVDRRIPLEHKPGKTWNAGRQINISEVAKLIAPEMLKKLRNECGGLQTLLKNHNHIFCIAQGKVQFKIPGHSTINIRKRKKKSKAPLRKVKPCWFHQNHPDGCPAPEIECDFQH